MISDTRAANLMVWSMLLRHIRWHLLLPLLHGQGTLGMPTLMLLPEWLLQDLRQQLRRGVSLIRRYVLQRLLVHSHLRTVGRWMLEQSSANKHEAAVLV